MTPRPPTGFQYGVRVAEDRRVRITEDGRVRVIEQYLELWVKEVGPTDIWVKES